MASNDNVENPHNKMLDQVSIQIEDKLRGLPAKPPEKSIFKVQNLLRRVNERAYEPECVAIGPYHRYNDKRPHLRYMEEQKLHYLQQMLMRQETSVDRYVQALRKIEAEARQLYAEIDTLNQEEFIEMMLLDGCFIIECFCKEKEELQDENDPLFGVEWIHTNIHRDLLLLENQLPFVVLTTLYDLVKDEDDDDERLNIIDLACNFFPYANTSDGLSEKINDCKHLLDLVHKAMIVDVSQERDSGRWITIRSATELSTSGIKFKSVKNHHLMGIKFNKDTLEIPTISIEDSTEPLLRNLIAYEQNCKGGKENYVTDYVAFMDYLINTPKDVELLRIEGIIDNQLGDDEVVSKMFSKMCASVTLSEFYCYAGISDEIDKYCGKRRNRWMAALKRDYFYSPWALISVLAAIVLLLLTLMQTIYSVISYYEKD